VRDFALTNRDNRPSHSANRNPQFEFLTPPVFNTHHTETEMLRYLRKLEFARSSLCHSMIPLGLVHDEVERHGGDVPIFLAGVCQLHPFAPADQTTGLHRMCHQLEEWFAEITGLPRFHLQPNAGSQGEYAGLLAIPRYHGSRNETRRTFV